MHLFGVGLRLLAAAILGCRTGRHLAARNGDSARGSEGKARTIIRRAGYPALLQRDATQMLAMTTSGDDLHEVVLTEGEEIQVFREKELPECAI